MHSLPENYVNSLYEWSQSIQPINPLKATILLEKKWIDNASVLKTYLRSFGFKNADVISFDFEFHNKYSFDCKSEKAQSIFY
jgi:hypothetical protein